MILADIVDGVMDCLADLGYDAHSSPPDQYELPAAVVELPNEITYHSAFARRENVQLTVTAVVSRADATDAWQRLYAAFSSEETPDVDTLPIATALEAWEGPWISLAVLTADTFGTVPLGSEGFGLAGQFHLSVTVGPAAAS